MDLLIGILGFGLCILFDFNRIGKKYRALNLCFPLGALLILGSTLWCMLAGGRLWLRDFWTWKKVLCAAGAGLSLAVEIYTLFFALPFDHTYMQSDDLPVITTGVYGLCRHPGFWPFTVCYGFLALLINTREMAACAVLFSFANWFYILLQDRYIFPRYIRGYEAYRKRVPFLIPAWTGIRSSFLQKWGKR